MKNLNIISVLSFVLAFTLGGAVSELALEAKAQTSVEVEVDGSANVESGSNTNAETSVEGEATTESDSEESAEVESRGTSNAILNVDGNAVRSSVSEEVTVNPWAPGQIGATTVAEVNAFIEAESMEDENLRHVKINEDGSIEVAYDRPARFLGIIPVKLVTRAAVDAEGNARVNFPWYRIFFAVTAQDINEAELSNEMKAVASSSVNANAEVSLNAAAARIARLIAAMEASANVEAESNTEAEVEN